MRNIPKKLELSRFWCTGKGDYITNIVHAGNKLYQPLKAQAKAGMWYITKLPQVTVPPVRFQLHSLLLDT